MYRIWILWHTFGHFSVNRSHQKRNTLEPAPLTYTIPPLDEPLESQSIQHSVRTQIWRRSSSAECLCLRMGFPLAGKVLPARQLLQSKQNTRPNKAVKTKRHSSSCRYNRHLDQSVAIQFGQKLRRAEAEVDVDVEPVLPQMIVCLLPLESPLLSIVITVGTP